MKFFNAANILNIFEKKREMTKNQLGLGTAAIGRPLYINIKDKQNEPFNMENFKSKGLEVLEKAYQTGIRYYDTAPGYGLAEELLTQWVKTKNDSSIEVATKWGYVYTANFDQNANSHEVKDHSLEQLVKQWEVSKKLFPYLTTLQIHSATFDTGVLENEAVLQKLAEIKKIHQIRIGITTSGDNQADVLKKALEINIDNLPLFEVFQVTYNILEQTVSPILTEIKKRGSRIIIKEGMANGRLLPNSNFPKYQKLYISLQQLADKYQVGPDAIALRFCMQTTSPSIILSGAGETKQLEENSKATTFELTADELDNLKTYGINATTYWSERKQLAWN